MTTANEIVLRKVNWRGVLNEFHDYYNGHYDNLGENGYFITKEQAENILDCFYDMLGIAIWMRKTFTAIPDEKMEALLSKFMEGKKILTGKTGRDKRS